MTITDPDTHAARLVLLTCSKLHDIAEADGVSIDAASMAIAVYETITGFPLSDDALRILIAYARLKLEESS